MIDKLILILTDKIRVRVAKTTLTNTSLLLLQMLVIIMLLLLSDLEIKSEINSILLIVLGILSSKIKESIIT